MIQSMNHVSFTVFDLDRAVRFYRDGLGLGLVDVSGRDPGFSAQVTGIEGAHLRIAYLRTTNCAVELVEYLSPRSGKADTRTSNVGSAHVCFDVNDFEGMVAGIVDAGGRLAGECQTIPEGPNRGRQVAYLEDLDGNTIELISV